MTTGAIVRRGTVGGCSEGVRRKDSPCRAERKSVSNISESWNVGEKDGIGAECRRFRVSLASAEKNKEVISLQVWGIDCVKRWTTLRFSEKEANAARTCILYFGQQEPPITVVK